MQGATAVDETQDAMQIIRDRIEFGPRVALGLRQENVVEWTASPEGLARDPGMATNSAESAIRMRALAAYTSPEYVRTWGFTEEAYCR